MRREVGGGEGTGLGVVSREEMGCLINIARSDPVSLSLPYSSSSSSTDDEEDDEEYHRMCVQAY